MRDFYETPFIFEYNSFMARKTFDIKKCRYCQSSFNEGAKEHVFPKGLGGPRIFVDNVCEQCNKKFSDYERELMRDSPVAFMRSVEGVEGYKRSNIQTGAFLAPILLTFDQETRIVYEVGHRYPFENFIRPQIILIEERFYIEVMRVRALRILIENSPNGKEILQSLS